MKLRMPVFWSSVANSDGEVQPLDLQPGGQVDLEALVHRLLGGAQRERRARRVLGDQVLRGLVDLGVRHDLVGEPDRQRLGGGHLPAGEDQVLRLRRADQPRQPLRAARAGDDAEQDLRLADLRALAEHPEVGAQREFEPAAERVAGDGRDDRLGDVRDDVERGLERGRPLGHLGDPSGAISLMSAPAAKTRSPP